MRRVLMMCLLTAASVQSAAATEDLPDPTRPANYFTAETIDIQELPAKEVDFRLTAIRISTEDRAAIINGVLVRNGDVLGTARIVDIQPDSVTVEYDEKRLSIPLYSRKVTKTVVKR